MKKITLLLICLSVPLLVGSISGYFTVESIQTWYVTLNKPFFNPPNYLFGPVWTLLYILMGISLYMIILKSTSDTKKKNIVVFSVQLFLNFMWSFIFFKMENPALAFIEILLMWFSILYMIIVFYKTNKIAALLNIPYILWVSFASVLNAAIWLLN